MSTLPSLILLGFRREHPPERACLLSASAPMLAWSRFVRPCVLTIAGTVALHAAHAGVPHGHARAGSRASSHGARQSRPARRRSLYGLSAAACQVTAALEAGE